MAEEKTNVSDLTIEVLKGIRAELVGLRVETKDGFVEVREALAETNTRLERLAEYTQTGFKALLTQGDRRFLDHEGRLRRLEEHAGIDPTR